MLIVYTAPMHYLTPNAYAGADKVDLCATLIGGPGDCWRASERLYWQLVEVHQQLRDGRAWAARHGPGYRGGVGAALRRVEQDADRRWHRARGRYVDEMRMSWRNRRAAWEDLLAWPRVTLVCICPEVRRCQRATLAAILARLGAVYVGERDPTLNVPLGDDLVVPSSIDRYGHQPPAAPSEPPSEPLPSARRPRRP